MKVIIVAVCMVVCMVAGGAGAAEKNRSVSRIEVARAAVEGLAAKADSNKAVADDLQLARTALGKAEAAYAKSRKWLGLLGIGHKKIEAEQDISHYTGMVDLAVTLANSRLEKARIEEELAALSRQVTTVKAKVKVFDERRAELERLRADSARLEAMTKELVVVKADKVLLASQVDLLMAERGQADKARLEKGELTRKLDELKVDNSRLMEQLEKLTGERNSLSAQLEEARKGALMREIAETPAPAPDAEQPVIMVAPAEK